MLRTLPLAAFVESIFFKIAEMKEVMNIKIYFTLIHDSYITVKLVYLVFNDISYFGFGKGSKNSKNQCDGVEVQRTARPVHVQDSSSVSTLPITYKTFIQNFNTK